MVTSKSGANVIDPKGWFAGFLKNLKERDDHVRLVFSSAASEQWLNAEFFAYISEQLQGTNHYAQCEWRKTDAAVFSCEGAELPVAIVESKLVYNSKIGKQRAEAQVDKLIEQLTREPKHFNRVKARIGLLFAFHQRWDNDPEPPQTFDAYREGTAGLLLKKLKKLHSTDPDGWEVERNKDSLELVFAPQRIRVGDEGVEVGCAAQFFVVR